MKGVGPVADILYTDQHEWVRIDGETALAGISKYAAEQLGDLVYVELPEIGRIVEQAEEVAVVESVKAASEIYAPISGEIVDVNAALSDSPEIVNQDPEGAGWFFKIKLSNAVKPENLMDAAAYRKHIEGLE